MSEPKRAPLQTLDVPDTLTHTAKKSEKTKQLAPSFRFELTLPESNEKTCPEYNYAQLLRNAEKKRRKEVKGRDDIQPNTNGLDPYASDDEDKLREMARKFEAKYGNTNASNKKRHKYDDYVDLGAGYDENDSFIDNTDAYDEIVPEEVTTVHGGFYINSGALEFKNADGESLANNNVDNVDNDNDDEDESSEEEAEDADSPKKSDKRDNSSSSDEEMEQPFKKSKVDESVDKISNHETLVKKKPIQSADVGKRKNEDKEGVENNHDDNEARSKKFKPEKKFDIKKFIKTSSTNGIDVKKTVEFKKSNKVDASIESVVKASRAEDETSQDTIDSGKSRGIPGSDSECEDTDKGETRIALPDGLPENVREAINKLKLHGESVKKGKTFSSVMNSELLSLEKKLRLLNPPTIRTQVYEHLSQFMHCTKSTLSSRAKKLSVAEAENRVKDPVQKLKTIVEGMMPGIIEKYEKDCQRIVEEKNSENQTITLESNDKNGNAQKMQDNMPRKRFPWTDETKKLINDIANARKSYYKIAKPRKQTVENFISTFLESEVLTLWPPGWMTKETLMKYTNFDPTAKKKQRPKEPAASSNPGPNVTTAAAVQNCNSRVEISNIIFPQDPTSPLIKNSLPTSLEITKVEPKLDHQPSNVSFQNSIKSTEIKPLIKYNKDSANHTSKPAAQPASNNDWANDFSDHAKKLMAPFAFDAIKHDLSITPVNDFQKTPPKNEVKKDVVSITPYNEPAQDSHYISTTSSRSFEEIKNHVDEEALKAEKRKQKKREKYMDGRHKESKKRREDEVYLKETNAFVPQLSKEEQEQCQIEETMVATNVLSQLINDCPAQGVIEETGEQTIETEKEVQEVHDVMKSLKELEKLRSSPSHSPMRAPQNSGIYLGNYQDDYHRFYQKKEDKMRIHKKDGHW